MSARIQRCGLCKQVGHNRRRCPNNGGVNPVIENKIIQLINPDFNIDEIEYINSRDDEESNNLQKEKLENRKKSLENDMKIVEKKRLTVEYKDKMYERQLKLKINEILK